VKEIFGIQTTTFMMALMIMLAICLLVIAWIAWRRPVIFKLGLRNIPRRRAQTILIVVGLMLSTLIISAAFGTGDTLDHSVSSEVYDLLGQTDELVVYSQDMDANAANAIGHTIPANTLNVVEQALKGDDNVDGVAPILLETVPVQNLGKGQSEPSITLSGFDPSRLDAFGGLKTPDGKTIDLGAIPANGVVLSKNAADDLEAQVGDELTLFYQNQPVKLVVSGIAKNSVLSGVIEPSSGGMVVPLDRLQQATGQTDVLSAVLISNKGGVRGSEKLTDNVVAKLSPALQGQNLGISKIKHENVDMAESFAQIFTSIFLVMGLFSIAAGILLIVLIFTMLAAERRSEMGMSRAVGMHRSQLIQQFIAEGTGYALLAGFVGSALGVLAALGIAYGMGLLFGDFLHVSPMVRPESLIISYCLGVVITFLAVVGSSWRISRLNIVGAIRDIPDVQIHKRRKLVLFWGVLLLIAGILMTLPGLSTNSAFLFYTGMSLIPFGILLVLRFFGITGRLIGTLVGLYIVALWLLPSSITNRLFGKMDGGMELFFVSGIFLVVGSTIVIVQNTDMLLGAVTALGGVFKSKLPAIRTAVAYPGAARSRTGMTIAMFSLIIFSLVMMATISDNFTNIFLGDEANAGWDVRADAGNANPIADFVGSLKAKGVDTAEFTATGETYSATAGAARVRTVGSDEWKNEQLSGMNDGFITNSKIKFQARAEGYDSDEAIIQALLTEPNVAVVDSSALENPGSFGGDPDGFTMKGVKSGEKIFKPVKVEVQDPSSATPATWTVIGVIDSKVGSLFGLYANEKTISNVFPNPVMTHYYVALKDPAQSGEMAKSIEAALISNGVQGNSIRDELKDGQKQSTAFLYIIEGFMGLGLIVGIAAVGVIMFRTVVERRQQIGVLRALGFQRSQVSLSFLIEAAFIVGLGVISGLALGLALAWSLFTSDEFAGTDSTFVVPWAVLAVIAILTMVAALLMTWIPARQASRIAPAEALRFE
jgi:putative ABC transport system permease protein